MAGHRSCTVPLPPAFMSRQGWRIVIINRQILADMMAGVLTDQCDAAPRLSWPPPHGRATSLRPAIAVNLLRTQYRPPH